MSMMCTKETPMDEYLVDDDWSSEDPFTDRRETDVFAPFEGEVENVATASLNGVVFPPGSVGLLGCNVANPDTLGSTYKLSRKRSSNASISTSVSSGPKGDTIVSRRKKKLKGMPKRPLSAYNLYFQAERAIILARQEREGGPRIGFEGLGKIIGKRWKDLSNAEKKMYEGLAEKDSERYRKEMEEYHNMKNKKIHEQEQRECAIPTLSTVSSAQRSVPAGESDVGPVPSHRISLPQPEGPEGQIRRFVSQSPHFMLMNMPPHPSEQHVHDPAATFPSGGFPGPQYTGMRAGASQVDHLRSSVGIQHNAVEDSSSSHDFPTGSLPHSFMAVREGQNPSGGADGGNNNSSSNGFPLPPGMEIVLSDRNGVDRKYRVHYTCYTMSREAAHRYLESVTGAAKGTGSCIPGESQGAVSDEVPASNVSQTAPGMPSPSLGSNPSFGGGWTM